MSNNNSKRYAHGVLLISCLFFLPFYGCEKDLSLEIDGANPPTFTLSGSGNLVYLYVAEVHDGTPPHLDAPELWRIRPTGPDKISELPTITYGKIPPGFVQITPLSGAPPELKEGRTYQVGGPAYSANGGSIWFTFRQGKSHQVAKVMRSD